MRPRPECATSSRIANAWDECRRIDETIPGISRLLLGKDFGMSSQPQADQRPMFEGVPLRIYGAWLLCALLLLFCVSAKSANYDNFKHSLRPLAAQSLFSATRSRRDNPKATLLELFYLVTVSVPLFFAARESLRGAAARASHLCGCFDPELHLRPPPRT